MGGTARLLLLAAAVLVLFSVARVLSGADNLTSSGTVSTAVAFAVPIAMAGLGGLWAERAGIVNIGLEGMMILGTWGAGFAGYQWGPWAGLLAAVVMGALGGLLHAIATVTFGVDHIVSGVAINILGLGATKFLASSLFDGVPGGGRTQSPPIGNLGTVSLPILPDLMRDLETKRWFLLSDTAGVLRGLVTNISYITLLALLLIVGSYFVLWRTAFGLRLRSCGEAPYAAESLGVNVYKYKYLAVTASGAFAGIGGAFLAIVAANIYREGQTGGRGYIGLAAMIFGNWRPGGLVAGAGLFGYADGLQLRGGVAVHALLLVASIGLGLAAAWLLVRRRVLPAVVAAGVGVVVLLWYLGTDDLPSQFTFMTPYITTLLVLALASQRLRMPKADGQPYRKGQGG
jgi:simple sugar transport system permease protein